MTKFEMLRDRLRNARAKIDELQNELDCGYSKSAYFEWSDWLSIEREILAEMELTE
jgi:hypothetical protein